MATSLAKKEERKVRDTRLEQAIEHDDVDELHRLIVEERKLLDRASKDPFPNTPLHIAAAAGKTDVAMEMAIMKPSFARKLNPEGYNPMHLALKFQHYDTARALKTFDPKLIRVRGRCGFTPLHYIAEKQGENEPELLAEFLFACKPSIKDLTSRGETAVHIALKNQNVEAFKVLFGWLQRVNLTHILKWKDHDGNNVLHIAVSNKQPKIIKLLIKHADVNAKNSEGKTAFDIFIENPRHNQNLEKRLRPKRCSSHPPLSLSRFFSMELTGLEKYEFFFGFGDETARDIILVVSTLIATATYQAALSPPGGYWQDSSSNPSTNSTAASIENSHQAGDIIMNGWSLYFFSVVNSMAFFTSIGAIWATAIPLLPRTNMVCIAMVILGTAFSYSLVSQFPKSEAVPANLLGGFYVSLVVAGLVVPLVVWRNHARIVNRIDATGRRVDTLLESKGRQCER
ncbi:ankyrin repeat-containing protein BDA1-like [Syzygium oleosum]|uniref:ankyrin repeat-containing protein BDA1-like n=1 Tax=Syzygium oleosum TaxID=219896 RepID=UPI0024BA1872|nr:ankyrin repeat-containing protein BDA1-like [Syzygium oleosum]